MTYEEMKEEEPELVGKTYDELCAEEKEVIGKSNCCGANIYQDSDICSDCGEHCSLAKDEEPEDEAQEFLDKINKTELPTVKELKKNREELNSMLDPIFQKIINSFLI